MSISTSWLVVAVLLLRLALKRAPKWVSVLLWGFVAIRLICPFSIESAFSLIPSTETISEQVVAGPSFTIQTGIPQIDAPINNYIEDHYYEGVTVPANNGYYVVTALTIIWIAGIAAMLIYTAVSYTLLRRKVSTAVLLRKNIFQSENVDSPFVLGVFKAKIYLPFRVDGQNLEHVIAHEEAHIRRKDHWWKPLGFVLLALHWFNPLMWVAYILLCKDIELACDEKVIKEMDNENRADYTQALVACSVNRRSIAACPLAFGEVGVKERVKSVMNYKKPAFWIFVTAAVTCAVVAVCFLTNPAKKNHGNAISFPAGTTVQICYDRWDVSHKLTLSQEEADVVLSVLNGKKYDVNRFFTGVGCPFEPRQAFIIYDRVFCLSQDDCSIIWEEGTKNYYILSDQEEEQLRDIFRAHDLKR